MDRRYRLLIAVVVLAAAIVVGWFADGALALQYRYLEGCWPKSVTIDGATIPTGDFWRDRLAERSLDPLTGFFASRSQHRLLFYLMLLASAVGWAASVLLEIARPPKEQSRAGSGPNTLAASLLLAFVAGGILFMILISGRLLADKLLENASLGCVSLGYAYLSGIAALAAGLFVVRFFDWFGTIAGRIWDRLAT